MARRRTSLDPEQDRISVNGFLADSVAAPGDGKLYVQGGGWNIMNAGSLPITQPRIGIGILITVPYVLANGERHRFDLQLQDIDRVAQPMGKAPADIDSPDGMVHQVSFEFAVGRPVGVEAGDEQILALGVNLDGVRFERAGVYTFVVSVDGKELKRLRFKVNLVAQPRIAIG
jgi:hypothetical protein